MSMKVKEGEEIVSQAPYMIPEMLKGRVKEEIDKFLLARIIESSESLWSSPIVPVIKPDKSVRLCVDYRRLNSITLQF